MYGNNSRSNTINIYIKDGLNAFYGGIIYGSYDGNINIYSNDSTTGFKNNIIYSYSTNVNVGCMADNTLT